MTLDPVARLVLDEAGPLPDRVLVVDDVQAALTTAVADAGVDVRAWCDDLRDLWAVPEHLRLAALPDPAWTPQLALVRLPTAVAALEDLAERLSGWLPADGRLVAGGRTKHMTPAQNQALARHFGAVSASLGRQKSRVLRAADPRPGATRWPQRRFVPGLGLTVVAHGAVFGTTRLDDGTRLLLRTLDRAPSVRTADAPTRDAIDLGSGSGILATVLAQRGWRTTAIDVSASAVDSTRLTAEANGVHVDVRWADGLEDSPAASADLIVSNPPFHRGAAKDSTPTLGMIERAGTILRQGGELWLVYNSHLPYLPALRRHVGPTTIEARDRHYVVTRSVAATP